MTAYKGDEEENEYSMLGVVRDPLPDLIQQLAVNVRSLEIFQNLGLDTEEANPSEATETELHGVVEGPDDFYRLTRAALDAADVSGVHSPQSPMELQQRRGELGREQQELRARIREEIQSQEADEDHAMGRRYDYGPAVRTWLRFLARKQLLREMLQDK